MAEIERRARAQLERWPDQVESWKGLARRHISDRAASREGRPRIRLRVEAGFLVLSALVGFSTGPAGAALVLASHLLVIACHELPRALFLRALGRSTVVRAWVGGGRVEVEGPPLRGAVGLAAAAIGSAASLLAAAFLFGLSRQVFPGSDVLRTLGLLNATWGLAQVLPLVPFRAGDALRRRAPPTGRLAHAAVSVVAIVLGASLLVHRFPAAMSLAALAFAGALTEVTRDLANWIDERRGIRAATDRAERLLETGEPLLALELVRANVDRACAEVTRARLHAALAWAAIGKADPVLAHQAISALPPDALEPHLVAAYLSTCNRLDEAAALLEETHARGTPSTESTKLMVDVHLRRGDVDRALEVARTQAALLSTEERSAVERAASDRELRT